MTRFVRLLAAPVLVVLWMAGLSPAMAQFDAQQTYAASSTGGANAFTVTIPNINQASDLLGVPIRALMSAPNSSAATLTVSNGSSNILTNVPIQKPTTSGLAALTGCEIVSGQVSTFMYDSNGAIELLSPNLSCGTTQTQSGFVPATNLRIDATVNSNQLTVSLLAANTGAAATAGNPILVPFRDTTIASGDPVWVSLTSSASLTIGSGSTMGCVNAQTCRLWVVAFNNGGSLAVCAINALSGYSVSPIDEGTLQSSAAGTSGGNSTQTYYCNASLLTNQAVRILGYVEVQESTAGQWSTSPTFVQLFGPGVKRPGDVVQTVVSNNTTQFQTAVGTFVTFRTVGFTPRSAADPIYLRMSGQAFVGNGGGQSGYQITRSGTPVVGPRYLSIPSVAAPAFVQNSIEGWDLPNSTSPQSYNVQVQSNGSTNVSYPPSSENDSVVLTEIMG